MWSKIVNVCELIMDTITVLLVLTLVYIGFSGDACFRVNQYSWGNSCDKYVQLVFPVFPQTGLQYSPNQGEAK